MKWAIAAIIGLGIGTAHADKWIVSVSYDTLTKEGFQIIGITPDGRGGHIYHMQKPGEPLFTCRASVLVAGLEPSMEQYCNKVTR